MTGKKEANISAADEVLMKRQEADYGDKACGIAINGDNTRRTKSDFNSDSVQVWGFGRVYHICREKMRRREEQTKTAYKISNETPSRKGT